MNVVWYVEVNEVNIVFIVGEWSFVLSVDDDGIGLL